MKVLISINGWVNLKKTEHETHEDIENMSDDEFYSRLDISPESLATMSEDLEAIDIDVLEIDYRDD